MTKDLTLVERVAEKLVDRGLTICVAEVDTGGLLGSQLISVPGASRYFRGGILCYESRKLWCDVGGVPESLLEEKGPGDPEVVTALAKGVQALTDSDICVAESGWAGPTGGRSGKPPGLVTLALVSRSGYDRSITENWNSTDRYGNMQRTADRGLRLVLEFLERHS